MKNIVVLFLVILGLQIKAQTNCQSAQPFCAGGTSGVTFPATVNGPAAETGPNYGCLGTQPNPAWYYLQVSTSGPIDLYIAGTGSQDVDFICWGPFTNLSNACSSLTAGNTVDCSYSSSPTETCNITNAIAGQYYMVLITNFSNATQNIIFNQIGGTGSTNCSLLASNSSICSGSSATIVATNGSNLSNPTYSLNPGALTSPNATFVVSPTVTTTYTVYVTGTNNQNVVQTATAIANVTVNPQPQVAPSFTQASCTSSYNAVNLGLTFTPSTPNYTITWNPLPGSSPNATQTTASNLQQGTTGVTVTSTGGCSVTTSFTMAQIPLPVTFTINPPGGIYSITCANPSVNLSASPSNYTYTWTSTGNSFTGTSVSFSSGDQGNYTVTPTNPATGCFGSPQTFTIGLNVTAPTSSVNPSTQVITCANGLATFTGTALSPTVNVGHEWYAPGNPPPNGPASFTSAGVTSLYSAIGIVGTFTYIVRDLTNGCILTKTVSVGSASGFPTFQTSSTTNYSVGCLPLNQTTLCIVNAQSTNSAAVQFAFLPPASTATIPLPNSAFGAQSCTITGTPGTWTFVVNDPSNSCQTAISVQVLQNTVTPHVAADFIAPTQTLTCFNPTILATGTSTTANTFITWQQPNAPGGVSSNTIILGPGSGPATNSTNLVYANYTVVATNTMNACKTLSTVVVSQNFRAPKPLISVGNPSVINCNNAPAILSFTNVAVQPGIPGAFAQVMQWAGPSPQASLASVSQYSAYVPGTYTLTVRDSYNGCTGFTTTTIADMTQPPILTAPNATVPSGCGDDALLQVSLSQPIDKWSLFFKTYPAGAQFSPASAIQPVGSPTFAGSTGTVVSNLPGQYEYIVTNLITGCRAVGTFSIGLGGLNADFSSDVITGYAPLTVNFTNSSATSIGATSSITSVWSFGNGTSSVTTSPLVNSYYTSPGTYSVMMISTRGGCTDTAYKIIKVEIPSKMEIPNVFTPNGDGSNDVFFLKTQNLTEITALIYDRWGNRVYEVTSTTGNIGWDGNNTEGQKCAAGTYFYIIKASGKDSREYEQKGTISLLR